MIHRSVATLSDRSPSGASLELAPSDDPDPSWPASREWRFSWTWVGISLVTLMALQMVLGYFAGRYVLAHYLSDDLRYGVQAALNLASYFIGGLLIGVVAPRVRMLEPAVGALLAVVATLMLAAFTPITLIPVEYGRLVLGGILAFLTALCGASVGDKLTRNLGP